MASVIVVGAQWGDEGKGKLVDFLADSAEVIVRFQGGNNAGHTIVLDDVVHKLALLPSGVIRSGTLSLIGAGVVVDPWHFLSEIEALRSRGIPISPSNLLIAENATVVLPLHRDLDAFREASAVSAVGTTKRGIGPAYEDNVGRRALRMADLAERNLPDKIERLLFHHNALRRGYGLVELRTDAIADAIGEVAGRIRPFVAATGEILDGILREGRHVLFEGAQGSLLDVNHGAYPYVTSSSLVASHAFTGSGVGPDPKAYVLGIAKAYSTRVGDGPMPTELDNAEGVALRERGGEFGVNTGRPRRCGWFDAVAVRHAVRINGISGIALTKIDVLDELDTIRVCVAYEVNGVRTNRFPTSARGFEAIKPIYEDLAGWRTSTRGARSWTDLPEEALRYIQAIEAYTQSPVTIVSTSPERNDTIVRRHPFDRSPRAFSWHR